MAKFLKACIGVLLLSALLFQTPIGNAETQTVTISPESLNVRSGPGLTYQVTGSVKKGENVAVIGKEGDWYQIEYGKGKGWIASWYTESKQSAQAANLVVVSKVDALNIRKEPSTSSAVLGRMDAGAEAVMLGEEDHWIKVSRNGVTGWVFSEYITKTNKQSTPNSAESTFQQPSSFTVSVDALNVRKDPDLSSKRIGLIHKGKTYPVEEIQGNWVKLAIDKGVSGWVYSFHGILSTGKKESSTPSSIAKKVTIVSNGTNIRSNASTNSKIVQRAYAGETYTIVGEISDWYQIDIGGKQTAYVAKWVVTADGTSTTITDKTSNTEREKGTLNGLSIVIDPGHGGNDRGATGYYGTLEKDITLKTAEILASKLKAAGATVHMTRTSDQYVTLRKRVEISHQQDADAFISLHYDSTINRSINGFTTYYTAKHQKALAQSINSSLGTTISLRNRGAQPGNYLVLRENRQKGVLIELGFISNPDEERAVNSQVFREQAAQGIYKGLVAFFDKELN